MRSTNTTIDEMIEALAQEINILKKGKGGNLFPVTKGRLLYEMGGKFIYSFLVKDPTNVQDDTPAELIINRIAYNCQIVNYEGKYIRIEINKNVGEEISNAQLKVNLWALLEALRKKFEEVLPAEKKFAKGEEVFNGISYYIEYNQKKPYYTPKPEPNKAQKDAIQRSLEHSLSFIWGPPGTGKTKTIAKSVEAHLRAGNTVLLVSHANTAVDNALEDVANQLINTPFYQEGKLVRLGVCSENLEVNYPLVTVAKVSEKLGAKIVEKKQLLERKLAVLEQSLDPQNELQMLYSQSEVLKQKINEKQIEVEYVSKEVQMLIDNESSRKNQINELTYKLHDAKKSNFIKRMFKGIKPEKIEEQLNASNADLNIIKSKIREKVSQLEFVKNQEVKMNNNYSTSRQHFLNLLQERNFSERIFVDMLLKGPSEVESLREELKNLQKLLTNLQENLVKDAKLIATTLTKTYLSGTLEEKTFDVVIVDESSMAPLPTLYWAVSKAMKHIVIVGDFLQLPPICHSKDGMGQKWLGRNIYNVLGIDNVDEAQKDERVILLDTQYRMNPDISNVASQLFYNGYLQSAESTNNNKISDSVAGTDAISIIDTSDANPYYSSPPTGSRFNVYQACLTIKIAQKILNDTNFKESIGVVSPYKAHAMLINEMAKELGIEEYLTSDTVHRFQGGEHSVIIFDCVDSVNTKRSKWSMLDDKNNKDASLLLNVAITRAKSKLYIIANEQYFNHTFEEGSIINRLLKEVGKNAIKLDSLTIMDNFSESIQHKWDATSMVTPAVDKVIEYTEKIFAGNKERVSTINMKNSQVQAGSFMLYLDQLGLEYIDKRDKNGCLWVVGGKELEKMFTDLKKQGIYFIFAQKGAKSTQNRPSWFCKQKIF